MRIGIVALIVVFFASILVVNLKYLEPPTPDPNTNLGRLVWDSLISVPSGVILIIELVGNVLLCRYAKQFRKDRMIGMSILVFVVSVFDNVAIHYPLQQEWIALANLGAIIVCAVIVLLQKPEKVYVNVYADKCSSKNNCFSNGEITKALGDTTNKNIIAAQLYRVETSQVFAEDQTERIRFDVSHIGNDYVRKGHDVNSISRMSYELDRNIVDSFPIILQLYHQFRKNGDDTTKDAILKTIQEQIALLEAKLITINTSNRPVTKDDCCAARALTIFLSFKHILNPPRNANESQDDYIGEISLHEGDLKLKPETEDQLFSLYRTGILGAALLDTDLRHVFHYRKGGTKIGRKYSVSQLICDTGIEKDNFSAQTMYICLFTIKESNMTYVPGYMFKSISEREKEITAVLNRIRNGG